MPQALPLPDKIAPGSSRETKFATLTSRFGDGYSQRAADGLNSKTDTWNLAWQGLSLADRDTVLAALDAVGGWDYLTWTPFNETAAKKFIVSDGYSISYQLNYATIRAKLMEVFDL